ncbi:MAG: methyltransferase domain-containing protein [Verrucomicrobia bacterium]|nr:MAG: methyltransferase domain-containing protein [Verrucomicrobiota bacterium]
MEATEVKTNGVSFRAAAGDARQGALLRLSRHQAVFEVYGESRVLRVSEALGEFQITFAQRAVYSGRAVTRTVLDAGTSAIYEVTLNEKDWLDFLFAGDSFRNGAVKHQFEEFLAEWQKVYHILPEFKVVMADMQSFLHDLRLWVDQVELELKARYPGDLAQARHEVEEKMGAQVVPAFNAMHERMEALSATIPPELRGAHESFAQRQLHPLMMCAPFGRRTFLKPLGYAGDYEMVNMILRDPFEGDSMYARLVNLWFLRQWPAEAHRNRIKYLKTCLKRECLRGARRGQPVRILNLGCGPAYEVQQFLESEAVSDHAEFTLLDFNQETLDYATSLLTVAKQRAGRRTPIKFEKKSVHQLLKEGGRRQNPGAGIYDLIYCAGLFDYLSDRTCQHLMNIFHQQLAPGGLLVATNVDDRKPFRHMMEFLLDWHLIYRTPAGGATLVPESASADEVQVFNDDTEVNIFIEVRKPEHA